MLNKMRWWGYPAGAPFWKVLGRMGFKISVCVEVVHWQEMQEFTVKHSNLAGISVRAPDIRLFMDGLQNEIRDRIQGALRKTISTDGFPLTVIVTPA